MNSQNEKNLVTPLDIINRRNFIRNAGGCAALGSTSILSTLLNLKMTNALMATQPVNDYKALVCLFQYGGNDSSNMLAPYVQSEYNAYSTVRTNLAIPRASLLPITSEGRQFGMHPAMTGLRDLYNTGKLAFVANIGSLVEPITLANYNSKVKPQGLYSHSDLTQHWMTNVPQNRTQATGWGGRMADVLTDDGVNASSLVSMSIALDGLNLFENGGSTSPYVIGTAGATILDGYTNTGWNFDRVIRNFVDNSLSATHANVLEKSYSKSKRLSIDAAATFNSATNVTLNTVFPATYLGDQMKMVAKTIAARNSLNQTRQIFFVTIGGFDMHDEVITAHNNVMGDINLSLKAFYDATVELGVANEVTTFSASEFGRTLTSNGNGSDHGWGGNHFMMGGSILGGKVYGSYPTTLANGNPYDLGQGRLLPTTSVDVHSYELAKWFGIPAGDMEYVLPNITNFHDPYSSSNPLGFFA